jgi:enterochelin esterase-like enzyme
LHPFEPPRGRVETIEIDSRALRGNLLGDPTRRTVAVYLPEAGRGNEGDLPLLVALAGFTGSGLKQLAWRPFGESLPQRIDRLVASGAMGAVVLALPDCFTSLGGNQYVNSPVLGRWEDFLLDEMLPAVEARFRVRAGAGHRAVFGLSSGGYGALIQGLRHGEHWTAVACHAADVGFDIAYRRDFPLLLGELARHELEIPRFIEHLRSAPRIRDGEMHALMLLAMAASYDPDPGAPWGIRLPVDVRTAELDPERWSRWLEHDPLCLVERPECQRSLRRLTGLFLDCGSRDTYHLHFGARRLARRLGQLGVAHRYEEFDDGHTGIDYRLDVSLPYLYRAISAG